MTIINTNQLSELLDLIHDYWFNLDEIELNRNTRSIIIFAAPTHAELKHRSAGRTIVIKNAEELNIIDTEKVRDYDINEITFNVETCTLSITCGIPLKIDVRVSVLEIDVLPE